jgi:hypothetical protein
VTELANDDSWGLVLEWLLCAVQVENGKSLVALSLELVVMTEEEDFHDWMTMRLNTTMGHVESKISAQTQGSPGHGQGHMSAMDMGTVIGHSIVAVVQTLTPAASGGGTSATTHETGIRDKYSPDETHGICLH